MDYQLKMDETTSFSENETSVCIGRPNTVIITYGTAEVIIYSILGILMSLAALVGNILVIIVILKEPSLNKHQQNYYLMSLAFSDALLALLTMPFSLTNELMGSFWPFGSGYCRVYLSLDIILITASIWNIACIGIDRYASVRYPFLYRHFKTSGKVRYVILAIWAYSILVGSFPYFFPEPLLVDTGNACYPIGDAWYIAVSTSLSFFIPVLIICPVYTGIYLIGRRVGTASRSRADRRSITIGSQTDNSQGQPSQNMDSGDSGVEVEKGQKSNITRIKKLRLALFRKNNKDKKHMASETVEEMDSGAESKSNENSNASVGTAGNTLPTSNAKRDLNGVSSISGSLAKNNSHAKKNSPVKKNSTVKTEANSQANGMGRYVKAIRNSVAFISNYTAGESSLAQRRNTAPAFSNSPPYSSRKASQTNKDIPTGPRTKISKREKRFLFIILLVTGLFLICWMPFFVIYIVSVACTSCCIHVIAFKFFYFFGYVNSCVNPIIYTIFNQDFKNAFKKLFRLR